MAVHLDLRRLGAVVQDEIRHGPRAVPSHVVPDSTLTLDQRLGLTVRRRRLQRLQHGLVAAGWVGATALLLFLVAAGLLDLH